MNIPYLQKDPACLIVNEKPFLIFGGEVHNSSCSSLEYFQNHVIPYIKDLPINTLLLPVYFENIEKEEGVYDFSLVKDIIDVVREHHLKIVILWFGLWKNGLSTYVPQWMKLDREKYKFCQNKEGQSLYTISPLCKEAVEKDKLAFIQLMTFLKEYDSKQQTVIMVQVENEIGLLESDRDYSQEANVCYFDDIPANLQDYTKKKGSWKDVFKHAAPEVFMTYYYATALETIAKAGKDIYPLPMMCNAWIKKTGEEAGKYPSGGPIADFIELYQYIAPSLDIIAPDIYVKDFDSVCKDYMKQDYLMVPETRQDVFSISQIIYGMSEFPMIGYSPFGIEDFLEQQESMRLYEFLSSLGIERSAFNPAGSLIYLCQIYQDLLSIQDLLLKYRGTSSMHPFIRKDMQKNDCLYIQDYQVYLTYLNQEDQINGTGFIIEKDDDWYIYGTHFFLTVKHQFQQVGVLYIEEGYFKNGQWVVTRVLNGDEQYGIYVLDQPKFLKVKVHQYK